MVLSGSLHRKVRRIAAKLKNEQLWECSKKLIGTYELRNRESLYMQTEYRLFMLIYLNTENRDPGE